MGHKKVLPQGADVPFDIMPPNSAMSGTNTIYSKVLNVTNLDNLGLEIVWTGTPTGTISVLAANANLGEPHGYSPSNPIPSQNALTFNPVLLQPTGGPGGYVIDLQGYPFYWLQIMYTNSSGTGVLKVYPSGKDVN